MVVSNDRCPIQCWTVRTGDPERSIRVAYVERNVFKSTLVESRPARSAIALQWSSMCHSRFPGDEGNTNLQCSRWGWSRSISITCFITGTSRSSYRFGQNPRSGFAVARIVLRLKLMSDQQRCTTSCSLKPA